MRYLPIMLMIPLAFAASSHASEMVEISSGSYRPLYATEDVPQQQVDGFLIDTAPVTNAEFLRFVQANPRWARGSIPSIFAEDSYLQHWLPAAEVFQPSSTQARTPVTSVSWFAATAYCESVHKRLPTVAEWEYVAAASESGTDGSNEAGYNQRILDWYSRPASAHLADIKSSPPNIWGVHDLHGLIWEWTQDFNSALVSGESRNDSSIDTKLFCGAGAAGATDPSNYAAFMRFGFRSSLQARFTLTTLGFRCASSREQ